jgi:hypothetical protein
VSLRSRLILVCVGLGMGVAIGLAIAHGRALVAPMLGAGTTAEPGLAIGLVLALALLVWD